MKKGLQLFGYLVAIVGFGFLMTALEARHIEKSPHYKGGRAPSERLYVYGGSGAVLVLCGMYIARTDQKEE